MRLLVVIVLLLGACTDDPTGPGAEPVASVAVTSPGTQLLVGGALQLSATPRAASNAPLNGRAVAWSSSSDSIATVSTTGLVTAHRAGGVTITATSEGKAGQLELQVTTLAVATVEVTPLTSLTLEQGTEVQLGVVVRAANGSLISGRAVSWSISDDSVATITDAGVLQARRWGSATVTATVDGVPGRATVVVPALVDRIELPLDAATIDGAEVLQVPATLRDGAGMVLNRAVTWTSSNTAVATVTGNGRITGGVAGTATITATSEGVSASLTITVRPWVRQQLIAANDAALVTTITIADVGPGGAVQEMPFEVWEGVLRRGPENRYELTVSGRVEGVPGVVLYGSTGVVYYHFLEGYAMLMRDGTDMNNGAPHFRGITSAPGTLALRGALTGHGPEVTLVFRAP